MLNSQKKGSKTSRKQSVSSDEGSKGRRDRSASKERHHRSRSVSKEQRVSDSKKSGKRVQKSD